MNKTHASSTLCILQYVSVVPHNDYAQFIQKMGMRVKLSTRLPEAPRPTARTTNSSLSGQAPANDLAQAPAHSLCDEGHVALSNYLIQLQFLFLSTCVCDPAVQCKPCRILPCEGHCRGELPLPFIAAITQVAAVKSVQASCRMLCMLNCEHMVARSRDLAFLDKGSARCDNMQQAMLIDTRLGTSPHSLA